MQTSLKNQIMRRVYYSYGLGILTHIVFWQGFFLGVSALLLARWLHVASIIDNFLSVPVGHVPQYIVDSFWGAVTHGEVVTAVILVLALLVAISVGHHLASALTPRLWVARQS